MTRILDLDPARYERHPIHGDGRIWAETNCYVDLWVELLHAWGFEPIAALPFTLAIDFEGDQWTFFKFALADLLELYGLDVQELAIWRPVAEHVAEQIALGRPVLVEVDSYYLPDTTGTAYQREHVKTTVAVNAIDVAARRLGYFHNQGYFELEGDDFAHLFHLGGLPDPAVLPPYTEFVKQRSGPRRSGGELMEISLGLLRRQLRLVPDTNPFERFHARFTNDVERLTQENLEAFHRYSFATLRQFGACYELAGTYLRWLGRSELEPAVVGFLELATGAKAIQFQLARAVARKKPLDLSPLQVMAQTWTTAIDTVRQVVR
jgi:hypothetical protein